MRVGTLIDLPLDGVLQKQIEKYLVRHSMLPAIGCPVLLSTADSNTNKCVTGF